jgi:hypothetical protein
MNTINPRQGSIENGIRVPNNKNSMTDRPTSSLESLTEKADNRRDIGAILSQKDNAMLRESMDELAKVSLNKFVDHMLANPMKYATGHTTTEAFLFVINNTPENQREEIQRTFANRINETTNLPNQQFLQLLDEVLDNRIHEEYSKTGVFSSIFHNEKLEVFINTQDRKTFWPTHTLDENDYT